MEGLQLDEAKTQKLETFIKYALPWLVFDVQNNESGPPKENTVAQHYQSHKASNQMFPSVEEIITIGSRAEETNLDSTSDLDRLFIVGPGFAENKTNDTYLSRVASFFLGDTTPKFYWSKTENNGYYTLQDSKGNYIYPSDIHVKLGGGLDVLTQGQPKAALPGPPAQLERSQFHDVLNLAREITKGGALKRHYHFSSVVPSKEEDKVPAMRLQEWPQEILANMQGKLDWCKTLKDDLKGILFSIQIHSRRKQNLPTE